MAKQLMFSAPSSGSGKTTITCGILWLMKKKGYKLAACKCGPDYIDPMFHSRVLGIPTGNLDGFFLDEEELLQVAARYGRDVELLILEGAMGYYDGIGGTCRASSFEVARATKTPVILIVDCQGMANSVLALLKGFCQYKKDSWIEGVIFNRLAPSLYESLKEQTEEMGIKVCGYVPKLPEECILQSRHLGLVTAGEIKNFQEKMDKLSQILSETLDFNGIIELAKGREKNIVSGDRNSETEGERNDVASITDQKPKDSVCKKIKINSKKIKVAVAKDEAFCFLYEDNLEILKSYGCELLYFSPLHDKALPDGCQGIFLSGGYPELYAEELSKNIEMRQAVKKAVQDGICCFAECGGYLYLHSDLQGEDGKYYPMAGVLSGKAWRETRLKHFGYIYTTLQKDGLLGKKGMTYKAHEFHYYHSDQKEEAMLAEKAADSKKNWMAGVMTDNLYAGFPHYYFAGNEKLVENLISCMCNSAHR